MYVCNVTNLKNNIETCKIFDVASSSMIQKFVLLLLIM